MPLVRNTLDPVPTTREVRVRLVAPVGSWFTRPDGPREVLTYWRPTVGADGVWSVDVPANADYDAVDTWYLVEEPGATHAMVVPVAAGPHELRNIKITMPGGSYCGPVPTAGPTTLAQLSDVDATGPIGAVLTRTSLTGFSLQPVPESVTGTGVLSAPVTVDGVLTVTVTSNWGVTPVGAAYYDPAGAVAADAAIASLDPSGALVLTRPGG